MEQSLFERMKIVQLNQEISYLYKTVYVHDRKGSLYFEENNEKLKKSKQEDQQHLL